MIKMIQPPRKDRFPTTEYEITCGACDASFECLGSDLEVEVDGYDQKDKYKFKCPSCTMVNGMKLAGLEKRKKK